MSCQLVNAAKTFCLALTIAVSTQISAEAGALVALLHGLSTTFVGQDRPTNSYQTDLWNMEFQKRPSKKDRKKKSPTDDPNEAVFSPEAIGVGANSFPTSDTANDWGEIPGQVYLVDITEDTPFAEWQINRMAAPRSEHLAGGPSAWMMSRLHGQAGDVVEEVPTANGPSVLTLLVAVVACMVMAGALIAEQ